MAGRLKEGARMFMFQRLRRIMRTLALADWSHLILIILVLYLGGMFVMPYFEGLESNLAKPFTYTWWFIVTIMTVGYGDIAPITNGGRAIGMVTMLVGITAIATAATKAFDAIWRARRIRMEGKGTYTYEGHLVIVGYTAGRTERLLEELRRDRALSGHKVVLVSDTPELNPLADSDVEYVRGEMASDEVMKRASVGNADRIIIDTPSDDATTAVAIVVLNCNKRGHIVAYATEPKRAHILEMLQNGRLEITPSITVALMAHAASDPGISEVIESLLSHAVDASIYSTVYKGVPMQFGDLMTAWKEKHNATLIGVKHDSQPIDLNPKLDLLVREGCILFYIADVRKAA